MAKTLIHIKLINCCWLVCQWQTNFQYPFLAMRKKILLLALVSTVFALNLYAQNGQNDVRFVDHSLFGDGTVASFVIEVKAASADTEFFMSEQNYRFSFNRAALANPRIVEEMTISNFISPLPVTRSLGFTLFSPHNLTGSLDTVMSYNVELAGGDGYYLTADEWVQVGRIEFDILSDEACYDLEWHPQAVFPPTFVGEVYTENGLDERLNTAENTYGNASDCVTSFPVELLNFAGEERDCKNYLTWETATEINSDYFVVERSLDAVQFMEVGRVDAAGNSLQNITYNFMDSWAGATLYYRLKQVDIDGNHEYFDIIKIDSDCHTGDTGTFIDVFPNPVMGNAEAFIKLFVDTHETVYIDVMDVTGALISETPAGILNGPNLISFPTDNLADGTYFIRVRGRDWFSPTNKFIKLNK